MTFTNEEKIKVLEELLYEAKKELIRTEVAMKVNESGKLINPNIATQVDSLNLKLKNQLSLIEKTIELYERQINKIKLEPLEKELKR